MSRQHLTLTNVAGIADYFGVSRAAVSNWEARNPDYPSPLRLPFVHGIPIWDLDEIIRWRDKRSRH